MLGYGNATLAVGATSAVLTIGVGGSGLVDTWVASQESGNPYGTWETPYDWTRDGGITVATYVSGDAVIFDDTLNTGQNYPSLVVAATDPVTPGSVLFNNYSNIYSVNANIGGAGSVLKLGAGVAILGGSNSFTGGV